MPDHVHMMISIPPKYSVAQVVEWRGADCICEQERVTMSSPLSPLECALIELVASENWHGFRVDSLVVTRRETTGAGRYTYIEDERDQKLPDGIYAAQGRLLEMAGVQSGLAFMVDVSGERINYLEIAVYGNEGWDGVEREWRIV